MRIDDRRRHEALRLVRRIAEHHALVARALALRVLAVHTLRDVRRLAVEVRDILERVEAEMLFGTIVPDLLDDAARDGLRVDLLPRPAGDLAHVDDNVWTHHRLACHMRLGIGLETGVENRVGNLVRHFVGMPFRDGLRGEDVAMCFLGHFFHSLLAQFAHAETNRVTD